MLELEVYRAGNRKRKMDVKCGRPRTHWRPQAQAGIPEDGLEPMSVARHLQLRWCGCPAGEAGALHHGVKQASGLGIRSCRKIPGKVARLQAWLAPHQGGQPADRWPRVNCNSAWCPCTTLPSVKTAAASLLPSNYYVKCFLWPILTGSLWGRESWETD